MPVKAEDPRPEVSLSVLTSKLDDLQTQSQQRRDCGFRKLIVLPEIDCDMIRGQLRRDELLYCWWHLEDGVLGSRIVQVPLSALEKQLKKKKHFVGVYALSPVYQAELRRLA